MAHIIKKVREHLPKVVALGAGAAVAAGAISGLVGDDDAGTDGKVIQDGSPTDLVSDSLDTAGVDDFNASDVVAALKDQVDKEPRHELMGC